MKKLLFLVFICLLGFYACKKSDLDKTSIKSDSDSNATKIIGKWIHIRNVLLKNTNGVEAIVWDVNVEDPNAYLQINKNGTGNGTGYGKFTYKLSEDSLILITDSIRSVGYKIKTLTVNSLILHRQEGAEIEGTTYYTDTYLTK